MTCTQCGADFVNTHSAMAEAGFCLWCRPSVTVPCSRCGADCPGAFDGLMRCPTCRAARLGEQQYEDKQRVYYALLVRNGVITPAGVSLLPRPEVEASVQAMMAMPLTEVQAIIRSLA